MKRLSVWIVALAVTCWALPAGAVSVAVGVFGGASIPVAQEDNGTGSELGIRVPVNVIPLVTVEPYFLKANGGDKSEDLGSLSIARSGIDVTGYGANVLFSFGGPLQFYPFVGIGSHKLERPGLDATTTAYNAGVGVGFKAPIVKLSFHVRAEMSAVLDEGNTESSRKWANVTAGVSYGLLSFPPIP